MSEIPINWTTATFEQICTKISDGTHHSPKIQHTEPGPGRFKYVTSKNIRPWGLDLEGVTYVDESVHREIFARCNPEFGDVLLTKDGVNTGVVAINSLNEEFSLLSSVALLKIKSSLVDARFLKHYIASPDGNRALLGSMTGTAIRRIILREIKEAVIPLPPLAEQKRIAAKIEELFSELDAGEESLRAARRQLGVYRQSLLKQAFEGKLTEKWRAENPDKLESPAQLLARIQAARLARYEERLEEWSRELKQWEESSQEEKRPAKPRRPQDVQFPTKAQIENLSELPTFWAWISVADCAVEISDGPFGSNLKSDDYVSAGVRVVRLENIGAGVFIEEKESFISPEKYQKLKRHTVRPGDIIVASFINDAVRAAQIPPSIEYAVNKADCFQVHCFGDTISSDFLVRCFGARYFFKQLEALVHGVGRPRINTTQLGEAFVPLCPLAEQQEIVRLLDEQFEAIERNEREIDAALKRSEALRQAILKKAFTGQLVAQDSADEPASALLAHLSPGHNIGPLPVPSVRVPKQNHAPAPPQPDLFPEIVAFKPLGKTDLQAGLVALAIDRFAQREQFLGHTAAEKIVHLADCLADLQLERHPVKDAAGPNDFKRAKMIEHRARVKGWFTVTHDGPVYHYHPGRNLSGLIEATHRTLGTKFTIVENLLENLRGMDTRTIEIFATVYAAWNNLLLRQAPASDDAIVTEAREHWHPKKLEIPRKRFFGAVGWMKQHGFVPRGTGRLVESR